MKSWLLIGLTLMVAGRLSAELPTQVSFADPNLRYSGRFDRRNTNGPVASWPACMVTLKFQGTDLDVQLNAQGNDFWQIAVDGEPTRVISLETGVHRYAVAKGLKDSPHTIVLMKATEGFVGVTQVQGFQLNAGAKLLPLPEPARRLEVIGDSISAGYGNMTTNSSEGFSPQTENAYFTYGAIAARRVGADYLCVAFSGKKIWPDNMLPDLYDHSIVFDPASKWDFSLWTPDVVLINLATNDFWKQNPDEAGWTKAYAAFVGRVRQHYPKAVIYCALGTMLDDSDARQPYATARRYLNKVVADLTAAGDTKVRLIDFGIQSPQNNLGAGNHPSRRTHEIMAEQLIAALHRDCGW